MAPNRWLGGGKKSPIFPQISAFLNSELPLERLPLIGGGGSSFDPAQQLRRLSDNTQENTRRVRIMMQRMLQSAPGVLPPMAEELRVKEDGCLRFLSLNMAHGRSDAPHQVFLRRSQVESHVAEIAATIQQANADIVGLQEADGPSAWSGNFDHVDTLAAATGLTSSFRGDHNPFRIGPLNVEAGTALVARWPLVERQSLPFGSNWRDTKGFVVAAVDVPAWGITVDVVSLHLDFLRPTLRRQQIRTLIEELQSRDRPRVVMGDLNCSVHLEPQSMRLLFSELDLAAWAPHTLAPTFPSHKPRFRLDWILASKAFEFAAHHTVATRLSDHLGVVADLRLR